VIFINFINHKRQYYW